MTTNQLLVELAEKQVALFVDEDRLRFRAPQGALTEELWGAIGEYRAALIGRLRADHSRHAVPSKCATCDRQYWVDHPRTVGPIRNTCGNFGRFIGYRPVGLWNGNTPLAIPDENGNMKQ